MDAVFAILVLGAVIFFGALISAGNERQRKALEGIREQAAQWAMQDLRLKREKLAREVKVDDPLAWLNKIVAKEYGEEFDLSVSESFNNPQALVCISKDGRKLVFSPISPDEVRRMQHGHKSKLARMGNVNLLLGLSKKMDYREISILNGGLLFDLEFPIAWRALTGFSNDRLDCLWVYLLN
jgi:hypothetical protein